MQNKKFITKVSIIILSLLVIGVAVLYFIGKNTMGLAPNDYSILTEESATNMVTQLQEVKQLEESSRTAGSKLVYEVVSDSKFYNVKVSTENNNIKTLFNVYFVDKVTGEVSTNVEGE